MPQAPTVALPKRLPLVVTPANRSDSTSKDAKLVNCYMEKAAEDEYWIYKRPGYTSQSTPPAAAAVGRGIYNWLGNIYSIFGAKIYKDGADVSGIINLDTTNGVYRFSQTLGATPRLQLGNGVKAYNYDAGAGLVLINDAQFPAAFVKGWSYLDGTVYVGTATATIQGSDLNDPVNWDVLNVLTAQIEPDRGVALAKQLVYTIIMKEWTTEVFYDAGNASGSPLGPVQGAKISYGCVSADSVQSMDDILFWISTNRSAAPQVVKLEGLKAQIISTPPVDRLLDGADFSETLSFTVKKHGHRFYVFTLVASNFTLAFDLDSGMWSQWTDSSGNYFPFVGATFTTGLTTLLQHRSDGYIYTFDEQYYTDNGTTITVDVVTPNFDGGTRRKKTLSAMGFVADQVVGSELEIRVNDFDYDVKKWTNFRKVDLSKKNPMLTNCGTFKRRATHMRHKKHTTFRLQAIDLQMDLGTL